MGGGKAHEFMYFSQVGEDTIITCKDCGYISNREAAVHRKEQFPEEPLNLELVKTPGTTTIEDLCHFLNIPPRKTAKAVFQTGTFVEKEKNCQELIVAVIRGDLEVEPAKLRKASVAVELQAATEDEIRACGMEPGYGSPIGARNCRVIIDESVNGSGNLVAGANKPGYHYLNTNTPRDFTGKVADIASAAAGLSCSKCGNPLTEKRGVEVGHIFQLGTRYTEAMGCISFNLEPVIPKQWDVSIRTIRGKRNRLLWVHMVSELGDFLPALLKSTMMKRGSPFLHQSLPGKFTWLTCLRTGKKQKKSTII
jgi:prolyl-tRNA synthetase